MLDGNDIWEALFGIMKGNVPDEMTEDVCEQLAAALTRADETPDEKGVATLVAAIRKHGSIIIEPMGEGLGWASTDTDTEDRVWTQFDLLIPSPDAAVGDITVEDRRESRPHGHTSWHEVRENGRYLCTCCEREDADRIAAALRSRSDGQLEAMRAMLVDDPDDATAGVPEHLIEAGEEVLERADNDLANYVSGETPDWDYGMEAAAVFKAMLRAALGGEGQQEEEGRPQ